MLTKINDYAFEIYKRRLYDNATAETESLKQLIKDTITNVELNARQKTNSLEARISVLEAKLGITHD